MRGKSTKYLKMDKKINSFSEKQKDYEAGKGIGKKILLKFLL